MFFQRSLLIFVERRNFLIYRYIMKQTIHIPAMTKQPYPWTKQPWLKETESLINENQTKFKAFVRRHILEVIIEGVSGDFNKSYIYKYQQGDAIRVSWSWNHYHNGLYFCRFFVKGDRHKESMCFIEALRLEPFIEQVKRDAVLENILKK